MRQGQCRVGGGDALDLDEVDIERAHAPRLGAHPPGGVLQGMADLEQLTRGEGRHGHDHRVEVVGLGLSPLGDDGDRAGQWRHLRDLDALGALEALDGRAQGLHNAADVGSQAEDDADGAGGPLGKRVARGGGGRRCDRSGAGCRGARKVRLRRRRGRRNGVGGVTGVGEVLGVGRCGTLLAHGPGVLAGRGEGAGFGLHRRLGNRGRADAAGGGQITDASGLAREGVLSRLVVHDAVVTRPAVGAGAVVRTGHAEEVHGAVSNGRGLMLGLLGGGRVAALAGQLDRKLARGGARPGRGAGLNGRLIGVAEGGGLRLRLGGGGGHAQRLGRQAHEAVGSGGPARRGR